MENGNVCYVQLVEGLNGRLKITNTGHGTNELHYQDIKTNNGSYYILVGKNLEKKIDTIQVKLIHEEYDFNVDVSTKVLFIKYHKLPKEFEQPFPAEFTMLDKDNNAIE